MESIDLKLNNAILGNDVKLTIFLKRLPHATGETDGDKPHRM